MLTLYSIQDIKTGEYLCSGEWGEEPEWFSASELRDIKPDRQFLAIEPHDFSPSEWE